jgi:hypothetical protein
MMFRRLLPVLPVLALVAGPVASPAGAKVIGSKHAVTKKYLVTFSEQRTVTWDEPAFSAYEDCAYKAWGEAHGQESAQLATRAPVKMVVFRAAYNPTIEARFGTWDTGSAGRDGRVDGQIDRQATERVWYEAGACGSAPEQPQPEPTDCGTRKPSYTFSVGVTGNQVAVSLTKRGNVLDDPTAFDACELKLPDGLSDVLEPEPKRFSTARFLKPGGAITVTFHKTYQEQSKPGQRPFTRSGEVTWKVTFTPKKR